MRVSDAEHNFDLHHKIGKRIQLMAFLSLRQSIRKVKVIG